MQALGQQPSWLALSRSSYLKTTNAEAFGLQERECGVGRSIFPANFKRNCQFTGKNRKTFAKADLLKIWEILGEVSAFLSDFVCESRQTLRPWALQFGEVTPLPG